MSLACFLLLKLLWLSLLWLLFLFFFVVGVVVVAVVVTVIHVDLRSSESPQARLLKALGIAENRESVMPRVGRRGQD